MANVSNATGVFTGISELYVISGGFAAGFTLPSGGSLTEIPVAEDSGFSYTGGTPSVENYRIHGLTTPWSSRMTPGESEVNLFVPQVTSSLLELFGFTAAEVSVSSVGGKNWSGTKFKETCSEVNLGIAAVSSDQTGLFAIKKVKLLASIVFDDAASAKPVGIQLTGASVAGGDADAMAICEVAASGNPG